MRTTTEEAAGRSATILFVEDELALMEEFPRILEREGHRVLATSHPSEALSLIQKQEHIDLAVLDMQLPMKGCAEIGLHESGGGRYVGLVIARQLRKQFKRVPILFWTGCFDREVRALVAALGNARLIPKAAGPVPVLDSIRDQLEGFRDGQRPTTFIVHGHDHSSMCELRDFLQNTLHFPPPLVLREMASGGDTVIEKLERYAYAVDLVFVLLTPDDQLVPEKPGDLPRGQARQNVIFELGYFMGMLGRVSGKIILLYRKPIEVPSDIGGIIAIDITQGIGVAGAEIRQELKEWL